MNRKKKKIIITVLICICLSVALISTVCYAGDIDFQAIGDAGVDMTVATMKTIASVVGALLTLIGIIKIVNAHSTDDTQGLQRGAMMIAAGIGLVIVSHLLISEKFKSMIVKTFIVTTTKLKTL